MITGPTFVIAGAARSGTTALYQALRRHPQVFMTGVKEPNYFASLSPLFPAGGSRPPYMAGLEAYLRLFSGAEGSLARGEASPAYLYYPGTARELRRLFPSCRIVLILRDPVERAVSHYRALVNVGVESRCFESAFGVSMEGGGVHFAWSDYAGAGLYSRSVAEYVEGFPAEQLRVWKFETLAARPDLVFEELCRFIGVEPLVTTVLSKRWNSSEADVLRLLTPVRRRWPVVAQTIETRVRAAIPGPASALARAALGSRAIDVSPATLAVARDFYREDVCRLQDLLPEQDFSAWLPTTRL